VQPARHGAVDDDRVRRLVAQRVAYGVEVVVPPPARYVGLDEDVRERMDIVCLRGTQEQVLALQRRKL